MFSRGRFNPIRGRRDNTAATQTLPVRDSNGVTSSYAADQSTEAADQSTLDPILGPDETKGGGKAKQAAGHISLHSDFDDVSALNDSLYFGANTTTEFSSPVKSQVAKNIEGPYSPESPIQQDVTETDIQTVETENVFSTMKGGGKKYAQFDVEQAVSRILGVSTDLSLEPEKEDKISPAITKSTSFDEHDQLEDSHANSGFREWVRDSPFWLKMLFVGSLFFLSVAFFLVVVGVYVATKTESESNASSNIYGGESWSPNTFFPQDSGIDEFIPPEMPFPIVPKPTAAPIEAPTKVVFVPPLEPVDTPVTVLAKPPSSSPVEVISPTAAPQDVADSTIAPTAVTVPMQTTVYITAGMLPNTPEVTEILSSLPGTANNAFLAHLGDWNNITNVRCDDTVFQQVTTFYRQTSVPVYFAVGDNEFNDCPNPEEGLSNWKKYLYNFYKFWPNPPWQVAHQGQISQEYKNYNENLLFVHNQAVFLTLNLVSGIVHDENEFQQRIEANLAWIKLAYTFYHERVKSIVIFAHSNVATGTKPNVEFYDKLYESIEEEYPNVRFIIAHRGSGRWGLKQGYKGIKNLDVINVPAGMVPPLKLVFREGRPIALQADWNKKSN